MSINTVVIKQEQLTKSFFSSGSGHEKILVMGSCRVVNIVNYLDQWNRENGNRFTIYSLDPFNFNWNSKEERVDYDEAIIGCEDDNYLLDMIRNVDIFIHEYYNNAGMFNVNKDDNKNIYQFGMAPKRDICIPNFNDVFILFGDIVSFDIDIRKQAIQDYNVIGKLSPQLQQQIYDKGQKNLLKFYDICDKTSLPEFKNYFQKNIIKERLFWSYNHTARKFTTGLFEMMNEKYLDLDLSKGYYPDHIDIFANNHTLLTEYDKAWYHFEWDENVIPLKNKLF
jgi:hypothetical protein